MASLVLLAQRLFAAVPDAVMAVVFLTIWISPFALGESAVRNGMLVMLVEFILIHASAMLGGFALNDTLARGKRLLAVAGLGSFYLIFVLAFMLIFREWWPLAAFGVLLLGKFGIVMGRHGSNAQRREQIMGLWGLTALFYLGGVFLTTFAPLPRLGMTTALHSQFGLVGSGVWVDDPHRVIAFGALYFGACAAAKWFLVQPPPTARASQPTSSR